MTSSSANGLSDSVARNKADVARYLARLRGEPPEPMSPETRNWLVRWTLQGRSPELPLDMFLSVPWEAFEYRYRAMRQQFRFDDEANGTRRQIPRGSRPCFRWINETDTREYGIEPTEVIWLEGAPQWDTAYYTHWYRTNLNLERLYPKAQYFLEGARKRLREAIERCY